MAKNLHQLEMSELLQSVDITHIGVQKVIEELYQANNSIDKNQIVPLLLILKNISYNLAIVRRNLIERFPEDYAKLFQELVDE
ncbi:hypothetical protein ACN4EE_09935 [Geminocystis sp. CENA526]|uniref:hypothetical protein n=1 Tax=Geminocystis sp. CENA526 TaxID=1355871 RepID=UPI003D6F40AB